MVLALAVVLLAVNPAASPATLAQSKTLFERGQSAYANARFREAAEDFLAADRLNPAADLMFDAAQAYEKLGELDKAIQFYRAYLARAPRAADRPAVEALLQNLEARLSAAPGSPVVVVAGDAPVATSAPRPSAPPLLDARAAREARKPEAHPRPLAVALGTVGLVAGAVALVGAIDVAHFQGTLSAVQAGSAPTVSYTSAKGQASTAQAWGITALALTVVAAAGLTGAVLTW